MIGRLNFSGSRMIIDNRDDEKDDLELHCGDCFDLEAEGNWYPVRIEHDSNGWYLMGLPRFFIARATSYLGHRARRAS